MDNKEFGRQLEVRTIKFAVQVIRKSVILPGTQEGNVIKNQITKSGTGIGANYREANRARSKADFLNKIKICEGEANETIYWLEIISEMEWGELSTVKTLMAECEELLSIFTSIGRTGRNT